MGFKNDAEALAEIKANSDVMTKVNLFLDLVEEMLPEFSTENKAKVCELVAILLATLPDAAAEHTMLGAMGLIETEIILNMAAACMGAMLVLEEKASSNKADAAEEEAAKSVHTSDSPLHYPAPFEPYLTGDDDEDGFDN